MAEITTHAPGNFCWSELVTSDQAAAKEFYSTLFGWSINDQPMGPDAFYTMLEVGGKNVAALYGMDAAQLERGVPPRWNLYVSVANADEATAKAKTLGATIMMEAFDVMDAGRMSVIQDPTGAMVCLWQSGKHTGYGLVGEPNSFCWWELNTKDPAAAKAFYTQLLGWEVGGDENYPEWKINGISQGGMMEIQPEWGPVPPNWLSYIMVDDCDAKVAQAKELGGSVMMGPQDIPNMGRFAVLGDPQKAVFAIFQLAAK